MSVCPMAGVSHADDHRVSRPTVDRHERDRPMTHQLRAQMSIADERQNGWRRESADDRRRSSERAATVAGPGRRLTIVTGLSIADIRRRIAGAFAEA
jgi:hypothetical protein